MRNPVTGAKQYIALTALCIVIALFVPVPMFILDIMLSLLLLAAFAGILFGLSRTIFKSGSPTGTLARVAKAQEFMAVFVPLLTLVVLVALGRSFLGSGYMGEVVSAFGAYTTGGPFPLGFVTTTRNFVVAFLVFYGILHSIQNPELPRSIREIAKKENPPRTFIWQAPKIIISLILFFSIAALFLFKEAPVFEALRRLSFWYNGTGAILSFFMIYFLADLLGYVMGGKDSPGMIERIPLPRFAQYALARLALALTVFNFILGLIPGFPMVPYLFNAILHAIIYILAIFTLRKMQAGTRGGPMLLIALAISLTILNFGLMTIFLSAMTIYLAVPYMRQNAQLE